MRATLSQRLVLSPSGRLSSVVRATSRRAASAPSPCRGATTSFVTTRIDVGASGATYSARRPSRPPPMWMEYVPPATATVMLRIARF